MAHAARPDYFAAGANRQTAVADWSSDGRVAFGADANVALWRPDNPTPRGTTALLSGHKDHVKAVKFLPAVIGESATYLVSGGDDKYLKVWALSSDDPDAAICTQTVEAHSAPINCIAVPKLPTEAEPCRTVFASGAADASIKIWSFEANELRLLQTIKTAPKYFPLTLALVPVGDAGYVLAAAGTRAVVQIFTTSGQPGQGAKFSLQATLSGHEGWVRSLDFAQEKDEPDSDLLLASASQDKYIRLWRLHRGKELPSLAAQSQDSSMTAFLPGKSPSNKAHRLRIEEDDYSLTFEALLFGHDDWIYSAKWQSQKDGRLQLLSTSADNSLAIWEADPASGIWITMARLGELSREKGATTATGSTGGFWTGLWSPSGDSVICLGRTGSWRRWKYDADQDQWQQDIGITGHTKPITGICWSGNGDYLLSTGSDQTTRLHARWKTESSQTWHEMSRPQIHGYDLNCIDTLGGSQFVSGADEKLMRVFSAPKAVARLLSRLAGTREVCIDDLPDAANMPVLGLSNKAIDAVDDDHEAEAANGDDRDALDPASAVRKSALEIGHPPWEDSLSRQTLWPEMEKLYGHGYEISCLAASRDGRLVASACKASSLNHAVIRLFEAERWTEVRPPLASHTLTVTRLRFSPDDEYLLSVGRDRQWAVFGRDDASPSHYALVQANPKAHSRMILDASWAPMLDRRVFATAGRDKQVKLWAGEPAGAPTAFSPSTTMKAEEPVTAIDFLQRTTRDGLLALAVGTEAGRLVIQLLKPDALDISATVTIQPELCLPKAVLQLAWRPERAEDEENQGAELAIAGEDSSLRIYALEGL